MNPVNILGSFLVKPDCKMAELVDLPKVTSLQIGSRSPGTVIASHV